MDSNAIIAIQDLYKSFKNVPVLQGVNFEIRSKETVGIIGKSGVGKSLLLKAIVGLIQPDGGDVMVYDVNINRAPRKELERIRSRMGFLFQNAALFDSMTVFENVALPLRETTDLDESRISKRVEEILQDVGLEGAHEKYPSQLSGGMRKRVGLARALVKRPDIVLFDEPTTGLDPIRKNAVHDLIARTQRRHGFTAVIVSHEIPDIFHITDRIVMLEEGKIVVDTPSSEIERVTEPHFLDFLSGVQSVRCPQTGLLTRSEFELRLKQECARAERYGHVFSLLFVNVLFPGESPHPEEWGFHVAYQLRKQLRLADVLARYDENTYAMLLPATPKEGAELLARRLKDLLSTYEPWQRGAGSVRLRVGYSEYRAGASPEELLQESYRTRPLA